MVHHTVQAQVIGRVVMKRPGKHSRSTAIENNLCLIAHLLAAFKGPSPGRAADGSRVRSRVVGKIRVSGCYRTHTERARSFSVSADTDRHLAGRESFAALAQSEMPSDVAIVLARGIKIPHDEQLIVRSRVEIRRIV